MYCISVLIEDVKTCNINDRDKISLLHIRSVEILMSHKKTLSDNIEKDKISSIVSRIILAGNKNIGKKQKASYEKAINILQSILSNVSHICVDNITGTSILNPPTNPKS